MLFMHHLNPDAPNSYLGIYQARLGGLLARLRDTECGGSERLGPHPKFIFRISPTVAPSGSRDLPGRPLVAFGARFGAKMLPKTHPRSH